MPQEIPEETLVAWSLGPGKTEATKAGNAENVICDALNADAVLANMRTKVFAQGSYSVRTNVRQDSDVDICILAKDYLFCQFPPGQSQSSFGIADAGYGFIKFKDEVEAALIRKFGRSGVTRGNKAFDVHANTYRIDADVVPAFEHRWYTGNFNADGSHNYLSGVQFFSDDGKAVINWPRQTYENGVYKNDLTGRRYKRVIRVLKRLRNRMQDDDVAEAEGVGSFLIESLVWNAPNSAFAQTRYTEIVRSVLAHIIANTGAQEKGNEWGEVNELKYLFWPSQPWSRQQAHDFALAAWIYIGLS